MSHLVSRISVLRERLAQAWQALALDASKARLIELEADMNDPTFWNDQQRARKASQETADLKREISAWESFRTELDDLQAVGEIADNEGDHGMLSELDRSLSLLEQRFAGMEFQMLFSSQYDSRNAILSIHAGAGGTDANDWTAMLLRMYTRFAETQGFAVDVLDESRAEEAGFKSVTIAIRGRHAYGWLRSEAGVHRLVRISPFDAEKMRHTTFALVEVLPEFDDVDEKMVALDPDDLRIDTFLSSGKGGQSVNTTYSAVRITHIPTGIAVSCQNERSQSQNKETALRVLKSKLFKIMVAERAEKLADIKGAHKSAEWGNQIRSYVLHPYKLVKDHRTDLEATDVDAVLNGGLQTFMEAYLRHDVEGQNQQAS